MSATRLPVCVRPWRGFIAALVVLLFFLSTAALWAAEPAPEASDAAFQWRLFLAPFHTVMLHLPIGFVSISLVLELYYWRRPNREIWKVVGLVLWISAGSAILVTMLGYFRASGGGYELHTLKRHESFGLAVAIVTVLVAVLHTLALHHQKAILTVVYRTALVADIALLVITGHFGGNLTHGSKYLTESAPEWMRVLLGEGSHGPEKHEPDGTEGSGYYTTVIQPIFEKKCYSCHGQEKQKGGYRMDTVDGLMATGDSELPPIVPGRALESYLVEVLTLPEDDDYAMPPEGKERLTPEEVLTVIQWIWDGAATTSSVAQAADSDGPHK